MNLSILKKLTSKERINYAIQQIQATEKSIQSIEFFANGFQYQSESEYRKVLRMNLDEIQLLIIIIKEKSLIGTMRQLPDIDTNLDKFNCLNELIRSMEDVGACFSYSSNINEMVIFKRQLCNILKSNKLIMDLVSC